MNIRSAARAAAFALCCAALACVAPPSPRRTRSTSRSSCSSAFPPGGTADLIARVVADKMKDSLGQPVIVENRPGAIGRIAADAVKAAAPDGTTIMVMPIGPMAVVPHVYADITYDPIKDFTPIAHRRHVPVRDRRRAGIGGEELERIRRVGEGESGQGRRMRRRARAACRTSSACCSASGIGVDDAARAVQGLGRVHQRPDRRPGAGGDRRASPISPSCTAPARSRSSRAPAPSARPRCPTCRRSPSWA